MNREAGAAVAEVLEAERLDAHHIRVALELEGLDDELIRPCDVEDAVEGELLALLVHVDVAVATPGPQVPALDLHVVAVRAEPLPYELRIGVSPVGGFDRGVDDAFDLDERHALRRGDGDGVGAHLVSFPMVSSTASRRLNCCSWTSR